MNLDIASALLAASPVAGVLGVVLLAFLRGWIVLGPVYNDMRDDRNYWRDSALIGTKAAEHSAAVTAKVIGLKHPDDEHARVD